MKELIEDFSPTLRDFFKIVVVLRDAIKGVSDVWDDAERRISKLWQKI